MKKLAVLAALAATLAGCGGSDDAGAYGTLTVYSGRE